MEQQVAEKKEITNSGVSLKKVVKWLEIFAYIGIVNFILMSVFYFIRLSNLTGGNVILKLVFGVVLSITILILFITGTIIAIISYYYLSKFLNRMKLFKIYMFFFVAEIVLLILSGISLFINKALSIIFFSMFTILLLFFAVYTFIFFIIINYEFYKFTRELLYFIGSLILIIFPPIGYIIMLIALKRIKNKFNL